MGIVRRDFLRGAALGTLLAGLPAGARIALGASGSTTKDALLFVILRGGMDGLNLLAPVDDTNLNAARPEDADPGDGLPAGERPHQPGLAPASLGPGTAGALSGRPSGAGARIGYRSRLALAFRDAADDRMRRDRPQHDQPVRRLGRALRQCDHGPGHLRRDGLRRADPALVDQ